MKLLVIADDFTGACDTGAQLAKNGVRTEVLLIPQQKPSPRAGVLVINTESRALGAVAAAQAVTQAVQRWYPPAARPPPPGEKGSAAGLKETTVATGPMRRGSSDAPPLLFKKIDSTLRGNLGAEIEAAMHAAGKTLAIVAAAIPAAGRTTEQGECRVNQVPLLRTEFARDALTPVTSSRISTLIARHSALPVVEIGLPQAFARLSARGSVMAVVDAVTDGDLQLIARAALALPLVPLLVGAAGLASALPLAAYHRPPAALPVLIVAGSMSEVTRRQVERARRDDRAEVVDIAVAQLLHSAPGAYLQQLASQAAGQLARGRHCILRTGQSAQDRLAINAFCQQQLLTRREAGAQIGQQLGRLARSVIGQARIGGLILTGGDTATAVAAALGAHGYRIAGEVAACIPCGTLIHSEIDDLPVITKAGGFGAESALCDALSHIEEMYG